MATVQTQCTQGCPIKITYPAEKLSAHNAMIRFRVGKKTLLPAYNDLNLPSLVQFQKDQQVMMFLLSDILETSYWRRIRNAYNLFGQLSIDPDTKIASADAAWIRRWLTFQAAARGIVNDGAAASPSGRHLVSDLQ